MADDPEEPAVAPSMEVAFQGMADLGRSAADALLAFRSAVTAGGVHPDAADVMATEWLRYFIATLLKGSPT